MAALGITMTACDDWTEPKSVDLNYGTIETANPEAYANYLKNLRAYRGTDHKKVYAWFDNSGTAFGSQADRLSAIPDSVDVVVIKHPEAVTNQMIDEMYVARVDKGQQFGYCVDMDEIKADWTALCEQLAADRLAFEAANPDTPVPSQLQDPTFVDYMAKAAGEKLALYNVVGFDCIMAGFAGKPTNHLTPAELAVYVQQSTAFLGIIEDWTSRHPEVKLDIIGRPQNIPSTLLSKVRMAFLSDALNATNVDMYSYYLTLAGNALPMSQLGVLAPLPMSDGSDDKVGYFPNGTLCVAGMGEWAAAHAIGAVGVTNTAQDYYLTQGKYTNVRELIQTVNPAAK